MGTTKKYDTAVIGAGAAGIMAAITASEMGKRVALLERNPQIGRKLLATGNGRCNLTNRFVSLERFHGATPEFIESVISQFDQDTTMKFFENLGLVLKEEDNGRIFPRTNQASSVVEVLKQKLHKNKAELLLEAQVKSIDKSVVWRIGLLDGRKIEAENLVVATGGRAAHHLGSTGDGLYWAEKLGHTLTPIHAALVPIETVETWLKDIQGTKVEASVQATNGDVTTEATSGDLLFTAYGVSGPSVMAQAGPIAPLLKHTQVILHIDLFSDMTDEQLDRIILKVFEISAKRSIRDALVGILPNRLIPVVLEQTGIEPDVQVGSVSKRQRQRIVRLMKDLTLTVSKLRPLKEAQVTAGGVDTKEIEARTLESKLFKGLYFAGEVIDVDGDSGGFNLQWAWSSGFVAGHCGT